MESSASAPGIPLYKQSGKTGIAGPFTTFLFPAIVGSIIAVAYAYLIYWIPFIYLNFILTFVFGFFLAILVNAGAKAGHVRSVPVRFIFGGLGVLFAYYVHWVAWIAALGGGWILNPLELFPALKVIKLLGTWGIGRGEGTAVSGTFLLIIWIIEGLIILGVGILSSMMSDLIYCERCHRWTSVYDSLGGADVEGAEALFDGLDRGEAEILGTLKPVSPGASQYLKVDVCRCEKCQDLSAVTLKHVEITLDDKGKEESKETDIVEGALVPYPVADQLIRNFDGERS